jgi:hypothetical protein
MLIRNPHSQAKEGGNVQLKSVIDHVLLEGFDLLFLWLNMLFAREFAARFDFLKPIVDARHTELFAVLLLKPLADLFFRFPLAESKPALRACWMDASNWACRAP